MMSEVGWFPPRSLIPSSQMTSVNPESASTWRSRRSTAAGPEAAPGVTGFTTRFPPIASFTMLTFFPYALCNRRESVFIQRSLMLNVVWVPSVIESPNAQMTTVSRGAVTSTALRKNQDEVVNRYAKTSRSAVGAPVPGAHMNQVWSAPPGYLLGARAPSTED